jgi:hypothetical protein
MRTSAESFINCKKVLKLSARRETIRRPSCFCSDDLTAKNKQNAKSAVEGEARRSQIEASINMQNILAEFHRNYALRPFNHRTMCSMALSLDE